VKFIHGTEEDIPTGPYDCLITNFFLDVFVADKLPEVMMHLKRQLSEEGQWLCTDFRNTDRVFHQVLIWSMHRFFNLFARLEARRLVDFRHYFSQLGMELFQEQLYRGGLIFSALYRIKKEGISKANKTVIANAMKRPPPSL
jgi:hypothetical protein